MRAQKLRHQIRAARGRGISPAGYVRGKIAQRRAARANRRKLETVERQVAESGFQEYVATHNEVLLEATTEVFGRYRPRHYEGSMTLFISEDEEFQGVSRRFDPRFEWVHHVASHEIRIFPGGHDAVGAEAFAETLRDALERAIERQGTAGDAG